MAQPRSVLHIPRPLQDYVIAYRPQMQGYLGLSLLPPKPVKHQSDQLRAEDKATLLRKHDLRVGPNGRRKEIEFKMSDSLTYATVTYADEVILYRDEMADADDELQYQQRKVDFGLVAHYTNIEYIALKDILRVAGSWGSNTTDLSTTPSKQYDQHLGNGNPIEDGLQICDKIEKLTGHRPNTVAMDGMVWTQISTHPACLQRGENQQGGLAVITPEMLEKLWRIEPGSIKITGATYNTAQEGSAADYRNFIGPDILFAYNEPGKINTYGLGSVFFYTGAMDAGAGLRNAPEQANDLPGANIAMRAYDEPRLGSDGAIVMTLTSKFDIKLLNSNAGWLLQNAVNPANTIFGNFINN